MATIYALASARGKAGVAVVRVSGPESRSIAERFAGPLPEPRRTYLRRLVWQDRVLDQALVIRFDAGASFTGEAVCEFHLHGGAATIVSVLRALADQSDTRLAEAGEFTRRALENGTLDLTQVEGLADLLDAETEAQRRQALRVLSGAVGTKVAGWRRDIIRAAALVEAGIDFADEDVPTDVMPEVCQLVSRLLASLRDEVVASSAAERVRDGFEVAIVGAPNVGKSTLLNALAGRDAAITSSIPGTTRDVIEVRLDLDGLAVTMLDTAGIRDTGDALERIGITRALDRGETADLRVFLVDHGTHPALTPRADDLVVQAKADLGYTEGLAVSGTTGHGVAALMALIGDILNRRVSGSGLLVRERHRTAVCHAVDALESALDGLTAEAVRAELVAQDMRDAAMALDLLIGRIGNEQILGEIFSSFCIGK